MIGVGEGERVGGKWELVGVGKEKVGGEWRMVGVGGERESGREVKTGGGGGGKRESKGEWKWWKRERERGGGGDEKLVGVEVGKESRGEWKMVGVERRKREWTGKKMVSDSTRQNWDYTAFIRTYYLSQTHHKDGLPQGLQITFFFYINQECVLSDIPLMRSY